MLKNAVQYIDYKTPGFENAKLFEDFAFLSEILKGDSIRIHFDKIDGQKIYANNGVPEINNLTILKVSDGKKTVLSRVVVLDLNTLELLSDISLLDYQNIIVEIYIPETFLVSKGYSDNHEQTGQNGYLYQHTQKSDLGLTINGSGAYAYSNGKTQRLDLGTSTYGAKHWYALIGPDFIGIFRRYWSVWYGLILQGFDEGFLSFGWSNTSMYSPYLVTKSSITSGNKIRSLNAFNSSAIYNLFGKNQDDGHTFLPILIYKNQDMETDVISRSIYTGHSIKLTESDFDLDEVSGIHRKVICGENGSIFLLNRLTDRIISNGLVATLMVKLSGEYPYDFS